MVKTISSKIVDLFKKNRNCWFGGNQLELRIYGHKGSSISRIARMMANEGLLNKRYVPVKGLRDAVEYGLNEKTKKA